MTTAQDIRREHEAAMASLSPQQHRALDRLREAHQLTSFNGLSPRENLDLMFRREAEVRCERILAA